MYAMFLDEEQQSNCVLSLYTCTRYSSPHDPLRDFIGVSHWPAFGDVYMVSWFMELGNQLTLYGKCHKTVVQAQIEVWVDLLPIEGIGCASSLHLGGSLDIRQI